MPSDKSARKRVKKPHTKGAAPIKERTPKPKLSAKEIQDRLEADAPLSPQELVFRDKLRACTQREQDFIHHLLAGHNKTESARRAGYAPENADVQAHQVLGRLRVSEALEAGREALFPSNAEIRAGIAEFMRFDRSEVTSERNEVVVDHVERLAAEVSNELQQKIERAREFLTLLEREEHPKERQDGTVEPTPAMRRIEQQITNMREQQLELELLMVLDENATVIVPVRRLRALPFIDLAKVEALGKSHFITGVKDTPNGREIQTVSRREQLELAARVAGLFPKEGAPPPGAPAGLLAVAQLEGKDGNAIAEEYRKLIDSLGTGK